MTKFICTHTLPPHAVTPEQVRQIAQAAQNDAQIRGYRSFCNLSEGKVVCIMEAPDRATLAGWFQKMNLPFDAIVPVELEGDRGNVREESKAYAGAI